MRVLKYLAVAIALGLAALVVPPQSALAASCNDLAYIPGMVRFDTGAGQCYFLKINADGSINASGGGGAVGDVSNSDGTLTITPTTGNVVASLNLGHANIWTGLQGFTGGLTVRGSTSGVISILPQAVAGTYNFNMPTTAGSAGQLLTSAGGAGAPMTWSNAGAGSVTSVATGNGLTGGTITTTGTISTTVTNNVQTGTGYAMLSTDGGKIITGSNAGAMAYTLSQANTVGFTAGYGSTIANINAVGGTNITLTAATSLLSNGTTSQVILPGQVFDFASNGTNYPFGAMSLPLMAADTVLGNFSGSSGYGFPSAALTSCSGATNAMTYNTTTHAFGCNTISGGGSPGGSDTQVQYNSSGSFAGNSAFTFNSATTLVTLGGIQVTSGSAGVTNGMQLVTTNNVGIYAGSGLRATINGTTATWTVSHLDTNTAGYQLVSGAASATGATLVPRRSASTTGFGAQAAGNISAIIAATERNRFTAEGLMPIQATSPTCTGTGTPTIGTGSTDEAGVCTSGTTATSVVITFNLTHANTPFCVVTSQTQLVSFAYTLSNTAITITQTATSGNLINYHCTFR